MSVFNRNHIQKTVLVSTTLFCLGCITTLQFSKLKEVTAQVEQVKPKATYLQELALEKANLALIEKIPTFGFNNIIADWVFLRFLQYFGDSQSRSSTNYALSPEFFDVIVSRDPRFIAPYQFLSTSVTLYAGQPKRGVQLLEKGLQSLDPHSDPNAYLVWLYKATDELLFLGDNQSARNSYQKVVEWARISGDPESQRLSALSARTVQFLANKPNSKSAQINAWLLVLVNSVDDNGRQRAIENIKQLGGKISFGENGSVSVKHPPED